MTSGFLSISIAIIVLGQPILHLTKEETFVGALASNSELIKPKWSTIGLNTYDQVTVFNLVGFGMPKICYNIRIIKT